MDNGSTKFGAKKAVIIGIVATIIGFIVFKLAKVGGLANLQELLSYEVSKPYSIKVSGSDLLFKLDILLTNPTEESLSFDQPYIKILYNESELGYTIPESKKYTLLPKSQLNVAGLSFKIALSTSFFQMLLSIFKTGKDYLKALSLFNPIKRANAQEQEAFLLEIQNQLFSKMAIIASITIMGVPIIFTQKNLS